MISHLSWGSPRLFPTRTLDSQQHWMICSCACLASQNVTTMADASRIPMKLTQNCFTNLKWIYWNSSTASCTLPAFHRINIRVFQVTVSRYIPLLCVVFVQTVPMHSVLVNIPSVMISLQSRRPQHTCPSCWTFSKLFHGPTNFVHVMSEGYPTQ